VNTLRNINLSPYAIFSDRTLDELVRIHPDGLLYLLRGLQLGSQTPARWAEAEKAFLEAARRESVIPLRRPALYGAAVSAWMLADDDRAAAKEILNRALQSTRDLVRLGSIRSDQAVVLASIAIDAGEMDLARFVVADWEQQAPGDLGPIRQRMLVEYRAGAYKAAIEAADRILAVAKNDEQAIRFRSSAVDLLLEQAESVRPSETVGLTSVSQRNAESGRADREGASTDPHTAGQGR
jgi:hypothetical protein